MGVVNASRSSFQSARFFSSACVLEVAHGALGGRVAAGPLDERVHPLARDLHLLAQHPEEVGRLREEPALRQLNHLHGTSATAPRTALMGSVVIHVTPISRTTGQRIRRQR